MSHLSDEKLPYNKKTARAEAPSFGSEAGASCHLCPFLQQSLRNPLKLQMGAEYGRVNDFVGKANAAFRKIRAVYPGLKLEYAKGG